MTFEQAMKKFNEMSAEDISTKIHPYVHYEYSDNDRGYVRKCILFIMSTFTE